MAEQKTGDYSLGKMTLELHDLGKMGGYDRLGRIGQALWGVPALPLPEPFREMGASGTAVWGGYIQVKDESSKWTGRQKYRTAADLSVNTSVIAAGLHYFLNLIAKPKWVAKAANPNDPTAVELAKFMTDVLRETKTPWARIVRQAGMYRFHGFSTLEWIAGKRSDGAIGLHNIENRPQHTIEQWAVDECGTVLGCFQRNPLNNELLGLPRDKLVYMVDDTLTDSPEGLGVFRHLAEPNNRLKRYLALEARAYERDMRGIPIGRAPLTAINQAVKAGQLTQAQATALIQGMRDMIALQVKQSDTGLLMDSQPYVSTTAGGPVPTELMQWQFELLNGPALGLVEIAAAIDRLQREMARIIGVEHLMLGEGGGGNRALAQDKSRNVYLIASAVLNDIVAAVQRDVVDMIWILNDLPDEYKPILTAEDIAPRDAVEVGTALARIAQAGAPLAPDDPIINEFRDMLGVAHAKAIQVEPDPMLTDEPQPGEKPLPLLDETGQVIPPEQDPRQQQQTLAIELRRKLNPEMQRLPRQTALMADPAVQKHRPQIYTVRDWPMANKLLRGRKHLNGDAREAA